jgi:tRNA dimethylallyltransferase
MVRTCKSKSVKKKLVAIVGPTGSGKTALGDYLAQRFSGEIVSADSKQVFRGMDIGTAKEKILKVPQHLIDIKNPGEKISVAEFHKLATAVIEDIFSRNKQPFLVGASMMYSESILEGYQFGGAHKKEKNPQYDSLKVGIQVDRELLKERLATRTNQWLEDGLLEEIQSLLDGGVTPEWLYQCGQEYRFFSQYLLGELTLEEAITKTNISLNQYAKRQYTWWRRHDDLLWVKSNQEAEAAVAQFLL